MKQILCFGDSNTWGLIPGTSCRYLWGERWTSILQEWYGTDARILEEGLCGRTTVFEDELREGRKGIDTLRILLESHSPLDAIVIMLGTNDCKSYYNVSVNVIAKGAERCVALAKTLAPEASILLVSPINLGEKVYLESYDPEFNEKSIDVCKRLKKEYQRIAIKENVNFLAASDYAKSSEEDQEHLSKEGHRALANAIYEKLRTKDHSAPDIVPMFMNERRTYSDHLIRRPT